MLEIVRDELDAIVENVCGDPNLCRLTWCFVIRYIVGAILGSEKDSFSDLDLLS